MGRGTIQALESAVETLARANMTYLRQNPRTPLLYRSGVRYRREFRGPRERWLSIPELLKEKFGDCEDLASWRIAELRMLGVDAKPYVVGRGNRYHIKVMRHDGNRRIIEDPSKALGMR